MDIIREIEQQQLREDDFDFRVGDTCLLYTSPSPRDS